MMNKYYLMAALMLGAGCKKSPPARVDNTVTRYANSLHSDTQRADEAREKANAAIARDQAAMKEAQEQTQ